MAEKAITTYGDDIMSTMPQMLMLIMGLGLLMAIQPITQTAQAQAYQGRTITKKVEANGELKYFDVRYDYPYTLWISAYFINNGPDEVEVAINYPDDKFTIKAHGTVTVNRSGAQERIAVIFYVCEKGKTAKVEITGEY